MKSEKNIYFVVGAKARNEAEAIAEAAELAGLSDDTFGVAVHFCGTQEKICTVYKDGSVTFRKER